MPKRDDWGARRPNTRRTRKPYNDDYKDPAPEKRSRSAPYQDDPDEDIRIYKSSSDRRAEDHPEEDPPVKRKSGRNMKQKRPRGKSHTGLLVLMVVVMLVAAAGLSLFAVIGFLWSRVDTADFGRSDIAVNQDLPDSVKSAAGDYRTILVCGVDSRDSTTLQAGTLADSNILVSIHKKTGDVKLLSIYRDTLVETTTGERMKLTEVYNRFGAKEQLGTINRNFDLAVTDYVTVNWKAVAEAINLLDGMDLDLSSDECKGINRYIGEVMDSTGLSSARVKVADGLQHVDGVQAVTYCRLRKGLGDDYRRTERQRTVISKALERGKEAGISRVMDLCSRIFPGISTSLSMTEALTLCAGLDRLEVRDSAGFPFEQVSQEGGHYYIFPVTLASNAAQLHAYLFGNSEYEPSGTVQMLSGKMIQESGYDR